MEFSQRLSELENKHNYLSQEVKDIKSDINIQTNNMNNKLDTLINMIGKLIANKKQKKINLINMQMKKEIYVIF